MLANLPAARSAGARLLFLGSALLTAVIAIGASRLRSDGLAAGLMPIFAYLFSFLDYVGANCALLILVLAVLVPERYSFRPLLRWLGSRPLPIAAATFVVLCIGSLFVYDNHPLSMDEYCAYFQSRVFASGHLTAQFPPALLDWLVPPGFQNYFLFASHTSGRVISSYWPSFALILTPFTWLGIPWACNPLISALTLLTLHRLALRLFADPETAGLVLLLTLASPVFFANGISYYSMPAHLLANAVYALLLIDATPRRAVVAGVVGSVALTLHNPVPHMAFALPWIVMLGLRPGGIKTLGWLFAGYLPLCLLLGFGWTLLSSGVAHEGAAAAASASLDRVGGSFAFPNGTVLLARLIGIAKIWVWAVPGLLILAVAGAWRWRHDPYCRLLVGGTVLTLLVFVFVPVDQGHGWGYRYFHSVWFVLPLFAAGALTVQPEGRPAGIFADPQSRTFFVACALITLVLGNGLRAAQIGSFMTHDTAQVPAYTGTERRVIFIDPSFSFYGQDLVQNDPRLRDATINMISHGAADDAAMMQTQFPELHRVYADKFGSVWSAATPTVTSNPR